jgi:hypothetical protein
MFLYLPAANIASRGTIHFAPFAITTVVSLFSPTHILAISNLFYTQISETFSIFTVVELASPGPLDVASSTPLSPEPIGLRIPEPSVLLGLIGFHCTRSGGSCLSVDHLDLFL